MRIVLALVVALSLALVGAPALAKKKHSTTKTFTTGNFTVTCTSSGQVCSPPEELTFSLTRKSVLSSVTYTTSPQHCSAVLVRVLLAGHVVAKTHKLDAGDKTDKVTTHVSLPKGKTTLGFQAQGFMGGCNVGHVGSWGGKVTVTVKRAAHKPHH